MNNNVQFNLTKPVRHQGFTLMINWAGGLSLIKVGKDVQRVQKTVQSVHRINTTTIKNWLTNPASGYWEPGDWAKRSESARIQDHITDFIHDQRMRGTIVSRYIQESE